MRARLGLHPSAQTPYLDGTVSRCASGSPITEHNTLARKIFEVAIVEGAAPRRLVTAVHDQYRCRADGDGGVEERASRYISTMRRTGRLEAA